MTSFRTTWPKGVRRSNHFFRVIISSQLLTRVLWRIFTLVVVGKASGQTVGNCNVTFFTTGGLQCQRTMILSLKNDSNLNCRFDFLPQVYSIASVSCSVSIPTRVWGRMCEKSGAMTWLYTDYSSNNDFYNNCLIFRALIGYRADWLTSIRVQMKWWNINLYKLSTVQRWAVKLSTL